MHDLFPKIRRFEAFAKEIKKRVVHAQPPALLRRSRGKSRPRKTHAQLQSANARAQGRST